MLEIDFDVKEDFEERNKIKEGFKYPLNKMIEGLSNKDYHSAGGLSSTRFDLIRKSVRAFKYRHLFDFWKPCFDEGTLCHDCILTPENIEDTYIESSTLGLETQASKKLRDENPDKIVIGNGMLEKYQDISKIVNIFFPILREAKKEVSFFHKHEETGLIFQVRPDIYIPSIGLLYDVKSTKETSQQGFEQIISKYNYDLSLAFYTDVLQMCGYKINLEYTGWLCVPKEKPHIPFGVRITEELMEKGRSKYQELLLKYMEYEKAEAEKGENDMNLIYSDFASYEAHSWEYRKENYIGV